MRGIVRKSLNSFVFFVYSVMETCLLERDGMIRKHATTWFLVILAAVALYLCFIIAQPFLNPVSAAIVLAIVFYPIHAWMKRLIRRQNLAAILSTVLVMIIVAVPAVFLGAAVTGELSGLYQSLSQKSAAEGGLSPYVTHLLDKAIAVAGRYVDLSRLDLRSTLLGWIQKISGYLVEFGAKAVSNVFSLLFGIIIAFFTLFFLFRDGVDVKQRMTAVLPLTPEQSERLTKGISDTIVASVYGGIAVGLAQGLLTGIAFLVLGLSSPVVWGLVAAVTSLIPFFGTGLVWIPGAIVLLAGGHWVKALILVGWGAGVVGQVDALIRPYIVSGRAKMHNLLIFFALLGGAQAFGIMGLIIGPVVVSITIAVLDMLREILLQSKQTGTTGAD